LVFRDILNFPSSDPKHDRQVSIIFYSFYSGYLMRESKFRYSVVGEFRPQYGGAHSIWMHKRVAHSRWTEYNSIYIIFFFFNQQFLNELQFYIKTKYNVMVSTCYIKMSCLLFYGTHGITNTKYFYNFYGLVLSK